jgi:hypothetical protein
MPKRPNVKRAASAQYQNILALTEAASGAEGMEYLSVHKILGNRYFRCKNQYGQEVLAEPRKLFNRSCMRVGVGSIVVASALNSQDKSLAMEIVGVITELSEARRLIKAGVLPKIILDNAKAAEAGPAGTEESAVPEVVFMTPEEAANAEKRGSILAAFEGSGLEAPKLGEYGNDEGHHASRGMIQARRAAEARQSIQQRLMALLAGVKKRASEYVALGAELDTAEPSGGGGRSKQRQHRPKKAEAAPAPAVRDAEIEEMIGSLMGFAAAEAGSAEPSDLEAKVAAIRAELAALPVVDDWETAADAEIRVEDL